MTKGGISLRWRLILFSWLLAVTSALALSVFVYLRSERQLMGQLEKTLETKCDEVISVLENADPHLTLEQFLPIETNYRFSPHTYYYQIRDEAGRTLARSPNLGDADLPMPRFSAASGSGGPVELRTEADPLAPGTETARLRSERVEVALAGRGRVPILIQTAASLATFQSTLQRTVGEALRLAAASLAAVLFLLWFVTTRALKPVSALARKASRITATNVQQRLPLTGRHDELDELAKVLNHMLDRLGRSLRQRDQFASGAAHQLRTPLTRIRGELDLVLMSSLPDLLRGQLKAIEDEIERLSRLCGRLLLLARLDRQAAEASLLDERTDLGELLCELVEYVTPLALDKSIALRRGVTAKASVRGSRPLLVEAVLNLLDNAIRYTPEGGSVSVSTDVRDGKVRLCVEDSGPGIPPDERERIFQAFERLPQVSAGTTDGGSGLGLTIVMAIAEAHGGKVELEEAKGGGSLFRLVLPVLHGS